MISCAHSSYLKGRWQLWARGYLHRFIYNNVLVVPIPGPGFQIVTHTFITSWLDYHNAFYISLPLKTTWSWSWSRMQQLSHAHMSPLHTHPCWFSVGFCVQFKVLIVTYKDFYTIRSDHLRKWLSPNVFAHQLRAQFRSFNQLMLSCRTFFLVMPVLRNDIPPERSTDTINDFQKPVQNLVLSGSGLSWLWNPSGFRCDIEWVII